MRFSIATIALFAALTSAAAVGNVNDVRAVEAKRVVVVTARDAMPDVAVAARHDHEDEEETPTAVDLSNVVVAANLPRDSPGEGETPVKKNVIPNVTLKVRQGEETPPGSDDPSPVNPNDKRAEETDGPSVDKRTAVEFLPRSEEEVPAAAIKARQTEKIPRAMESRQTAPPRVDYVKERAVPQVFKRVSHSSPPCIFFWDWGCLWRASSPDEQ